METTQQTVSSKDLANVLKIAQYSPDLIISHVLKRVSKATEGEVLYHDPNNPPVFLLEMSATLAGQCLANTDDRQRELYARLAQNEDELYHHMSSEDYIGRFAYPSQAQFQLFLRKKDIIANAVDTDIKGLRKLVYPRGTCFKVDTLTFTLLYNIEIRVTVHGDIQILYDIDSQDPVQPMETNVIDYAFISSPDPNDDHFVEDFITFYPLVKQVNLEYMIGTAVSQLTGFKKTLKLTDQFVYARVYMVEDNGRVTEIQTTHSDFVFDVNIPTALLQLTQSNTLTIIIPSIYTSSRLIKGRIDVEVYTTKGPLDMDLEKYNDGSKVGLSWASNELMRQLYSDVFKYVSPLSTLNAHGVRVNGRTTGGSNKLSFTELRDRVINHAYYTDKPINDLQLKNNGNRMGYDITTGVDLVTNRIFYATRALPAPHYDEDSFDITDMSLTEPAFTTGASCTVELVKMSMDELSGISTVKDNGERMTILPSTLFRTLDGITRIVGDNDHPRNVGLVDSFVQKINSLEYSYTPFHYVLDSSDNYFEVRPYYLEDPMILHQRFIRNNETTQLLVSADTVGHEIEYTNEGYKLYVRVRSGDEYKKIPKENLILQLAFKPADELDYAHLNGVYVGSYENGTDLWLFELNTNFDVNKKHEMTLTNFSMYVSEPRDLEVKLTQEFMLFFGVYDYDVEDFEQNEIDGLFGRHILDGRRDVKGLSQTSMTIRFGHTLENFWRNSRVVSDTEEYVKYEEDVYATYSENVYKYNERGLLEWTGEGEDATPIVLHRAGDVITEKQRNRLTGEEEDVPVLRHAKGSIVLDNQGRPIVKAARKLMQFVDIFLVDGIYQFATHPFDRQYARSIPRTIVNYHDNDIGVLANNLIENSHLYFTPKQTMGTTEIIIRNGQVKTINNRIPFHVTYYLSRVGYNDNTLRNAIKHMTHKVINNYLKNKTISVDTLATLLRQEAGDEVMAIHIPGLGEGYELQAFTSKNEDSRCSVKRKVKLEADGNIRVVEDITIEFINHEQSLNV